MPRRIAISQSNYIPWRGYFDLIDRVDEFVVLDDVQYTRQDWRNRNRIKTSNGAVWISVAIQSRFGQRIDETVVSDRSWAEKHWSKIQQAYRGADCYQEREAALGAAYERAGTHERLTDINRELMDFMLDTLGITTPLRRSEELAVRDDPSERLIAICHELQAEVYLSGPAARAYLDEDRFARAGVEIEWMDYSGYRPYEQLHGPFEPAVSAIDLLLNVGSEARTLFRAER